MEVPLPSDWDPNEFSTRPTPEKPKAKSFKSRLAYALERAKRLGTGSARVAMTIEYQGRPTVLKIAKNAKGMAQNEAEVDILEDGYIGQLDIVIPLIDYDKQNHKPVWIQTELAEKASEAKLCKLMRCSTLGLRNLIAVAENKSGQDRYRSLNPIEAKSWMTKRGATEEDIETTMHYVDELATLASSSNILLGDFSRASNWGIYKGSPVVIDLGFTPHVKNEFY